MPLPAGLVLWTASKTLPCGSRIEVTGPAGRAELLVEDRGPYMGPSRDLDLSPAAFRRVAGPLVVGTATVTYRVIAPAEQLLREAQAP
jgi:rare lipoprotein A (peptidoglycan hydrolase)